MIVRLSDDQSLLLFLIGQRTSKNDFFFLLSMNGENKRFSLGTLLGNRRAHTQTREDRDRRRRLLAWWGEEISFNDCTVPCDDSFLSFVLLSFFFSFGHNTEREDELPVSPIIWGEKYLYLNHAKAEHRLLTKRHRGWPTVKKRKREWRIQLERKQDSQQSVGHTCLAVVCWSSSSLLSWIGVLDRDGEEEIEYGIGNVFFSSHFPVSDDLSSWSSVEVVSSRRR